METNWAAEHLQVIRTLMERSAVYRRALAPIMAFTGAVGMGAAIAGRVAGINSAAGFIIFWLLVGIVAVGGAFLLVRRQAIKDREPFWSSPTRRVTQALLPALTAGLILSVIVLFRSRLYPLESHGQTVLVEMPAVWIVLYGCALHAAGFFMPRGMKIFGWLFVLGGCAMFAAGPQLASVGLYGHAIMGIFFGGFHFAYGIYLYFTEQRKNEA